MNNFRLYCLCTFSAFCNWGGVASARIVEIPAPNLERAVREQLALPDEIPITQQEMLRLKELDAEQREITDLTGLEFATNVTDLRLGNNSISDLSPLSGLKQRRHLVLLGNRIDSSLHISPLLNRPDLSGLVIGPCRWYLTRNELRYYN